MVKPENISSNRKFSFEHLVMDFVLLGCYFFLLDDLVVWQTNHFDLAGVILVILNIATAAYGVLTFFSIYNAEHELKGYAKLMTSLEGTVIGISALITFVAAFWWLLPFQAVKKVGGFEIYNGLSMLVYFITCLLVMGKSLDDKKYYTFSKSTIGGLISVVLNGVFFFFSYALLITSLQIWQPDRFQYRFYGVICLVLFYLPFRIFLLLRPPFHKIELASMLVIFFYMLNNLFGFF